MYVFAAAAEEGQVGGVVGGPLGGGDDDCSTPEFTIGAPATCSLAAVVPQD